MRKFSPDSARRAGVMLAAALGAAALGSCGGSTEQIEPFVPQRIIVLGDDSSGLEVDGRRSGINGLDESAAFDCRLLPIWTQQLAGAYGMVTDRCTTGTTVAPLVTTRAVAGAKAADLDAQIDAELAAASPTSKDLFTVMIGLHDVIEVYETFAGDKTCDSDPTVNTPMEEELRARGRHAADQVNRLIDAGARIIVSTVQDLGLSPYARTRDAASPGQAALLTCLTASYNARVRVDILQDGRYWGLVLADDLVSALTRVPSAYGLSNVTDAACTTAVPDCTTATLASGASASTHLWADDRRLGPVAHTQLAAQAITRARNNPF
jgi:phospholipase/lecithinase/hemolysin